jgi:hypothetical protein
MGLPSPRRVKPHEPNLTDTTREKSVEHGFGATFTKNVSIVFLGPDQTHAKIITIFGGFELKLSRLTHILTLLDCFSHIHVPGNIETHVKQRIVRSILDARRDRINVQNIRE